jgi:plastocyanin
MTFTLRLTLTLACWGIFFAAAPSFAHGPTIELSHQEMKPVLLNLFAGTTVHFLNTVMMPGGHVVVDEAGEIESPALVEPGAGWHYTFESVGTYELHIREHPEAKARIVVVPKRGATGKPEAHKGHDASDGSLPAH